MKRMKDHMCGCDLVFGVGSRYRSEFAAAGVGAQKGHPQNKTRSKMGRSYLGINKAGTEL